MSPCWTHPFLICAVTHHFYDFIINIECESSVTKHFNIEQSEVEAEAVFDHTDSHTGTAAAAPVDDDVTEVSADSGDDSGVSESLNHSNSSQPNNQNNETSSQPKLAATRDTPVFSLSVEEKSSSSSPPPPRPSAPPRPTPPTPSDSEHHPPSKTSWTRRLSTRVSHITGLGIHKSRSLPHQRSQSALVTSTNAHGFFHDQKPVKKTKSGKEKPGRWCASSVHAGIEFYLPRLILTLVCITEFRCLFHDAILGDRWGAAWEPGAVDSPSGFPFPASMIGWFS